MWCSIRARRIKDQLTAVTSHLGNESCEISDRDVFTRTNIEMRFRRVSLADENAGLGQIIRKDEFEPRGGNNLGSPTVNVWGTGFVATSLAMDFFNAISLPRPWSYIDVLTTL